MSEQYEPYVELGQLRSWNMAHDAEPHSVAWDGHIKSSWNEARFVVRGPLTDKKIARYEKRGFYAQEYKEARKKLMDAKKAKRRGNFVLGPEGRLIYSPM